MVLSIMILPSIVSVSVPALNAVPPAYEQGSLALGATETETWFKISIPAAKSGIAAGIVPVSYTHLDVYKRQALATMLAVMMSYWPLALAERSPTSTVSLSCTPFRAAF